MNDLQKQIEYLLASGTRNGAVLSALERRGYEIVREPIFGIGIRFECSGEQVTCYHPKLEEDKTADPP